MTPSGVTYYDSMIKIDLSTVECMMTLPYHPSNALPIREFKADPAKYLAAVEAEGNKIKGEHGKPFHIMDKLKADGLHVDQALVSGCAGGMFENLSAMADILDGCALPGNGQMAAAILIDARSIAATVRNGGVLTAATELDVNYIEREHDFDPTIYRNPPSHLE